MKLACYRYGRAPGTPQLVENGRYTPGMKTAVSVPDDIFQKAERLARAAGRSRSEVYSAALREYVHRHAPDEVTETLDRVVLELGDEAGAEPFVTRAAARALAKSDW